MTRDEQITKLNELRNCIPGIVCIPGCNACCAHVAWSPIEWELLPDEFKSQHTIHSIKCPFAQDGKCVCHEYRPITCRLFGHADGMRCPRGAQPATILSDEQAQAIYREYVKLFGGFKK